jgi:hypothetical protein
MVYGSCNGESLARRRTVVAILRLVIEGPGDSTRGEVVAVSGRVVARFGTWTGLVPALQSWLAQEHAGECFEEGSSASPLPPE